MAKVSISEAARLARVSRQHLYKKWITPGLLSVEKDGVNPPVIDTSELLRVFGELRCLDDEPETTNESFTVLKAELKATRELLTDRENQLLEAREREQWFKQHVGEVTAAFQLLENKSSPSPADEIKKLRIRLQKYQAAYQDYKEALDVERNKGFWARLFRQ
jgi:hypothetical protein